MVELPPDVIALVPMRNVVLFPQLLMPVTVGRPRLLAALQHATAGQTPFGMVLQKDATVDDPDLDGLCRIGTLARVLKHGRTEDGQVHAVCQGLQRIRIVEAVAGHPFLVARIERIDEPASSSTVAEGRAATACQRPNRSDITATESSQAWFKQGRPNAPSIVFSSEK
ncbi:MAG: LON peptidase substrate-binding domain-containing protein [Caldimonas sp.]